MLRVQALAVFFRQMADILDLVVHNDSLTNQQKEQQGDRILREVTKEFEKPL